MSLSSSFHYRGKFFLLLLGVWFAVGLSVVMLAMNWISCKISGRPFDLPGFFTLQKIIQIMLAAVFYSIGMGIYFHFRKRKSTLV
jgi:hypothetical protein